MRFTVVTLALAASLAFSLQSSLMGQVPTPPPASPTLWSFLGIPQAHQKIHAQMFNVHGKHPKLEAKPAMLLLADPRNLESPIESIKAAAEIKQAEDLKPQKIKAIKYLASIGCGCYDKDKKITKALIASMTDCTEDVRLEAIKAIEEAASGECCANCSQRNCCGEDVSKMLAQIAYGRDENGCDFEPSERVREAAERALGVCCPNIGPPIYVEELPVEGTLEAPPAIEGIDSRDGGLPGRPSVRPEVPPAPPAGDAARVPGRFVPREVSPPSVRIEEGQPSLHRTAELNSTTTNVVVRPASRLPADTHRSVAILVDREQNIAKVQFRNNDRPMHGELLNVWHPTDFGSQLVGKLQVYAVNGQTALVRPLNDLDLAALTPGTVVVRVAN